MDSACTKILSDNPADIILLVLALIVLIVLIGCVWAFFYAIFLFIFSKGDDAKIKTARNSIRYMIIGLFLTVMLLFTGPTVFKLFRMENSEGYSAKYIFVKIGYIVSCVGEGFTAVLTDYPNNNQFGSTSSLFSTSVSNNTDGLKVYEL